MLFSIKVKIRNDSDRYFFVKAENIEEIKLIISEYNRKTSSRCHILSEIIYVKKIDGSPETIEYHGKKINIKHNTIDSKTKIKEIVKKLNLKKETTSNKAFRYTTYLGLGLILTPVYINLLLFLKNSDYLTNLSGIPIEGKNLLLILFTLGIGLLTIIFQLKFVETTKRAWISILLLLFMLILMSFYEQSEYSFNSFVQLSSVLWLIVWLFNTEDYILFLKTIYNKYIFLEDKEQFTIGLAVLTFILGILIAK